jgi:hypothetical protein
MNNDSFVFVAAVAIDASIIVGFGFAKAQYDEFV